MAEESDQSEKTEEPTLHRIEEFRRKGQVAASKELTSVLVLCACIMTLAFSVVYIFEIMSEYIDWIMTVDFSTIFQEEEFNKFVKKSAYALLECSAPVCLVALIVGVVSNVSQIGFLFSPEVLNWDPSRIDPFQGIKRIFSMKAIIEAGKGILKFSFILAIVYFIMSDQLDTYSGFLHVEFAESFLFGKSILLKLGMAIVLGLGIVALIDFGWEKYSYHQKLKMTKEEVKQEAKERDGSPEIKQRIRSIQREMSQKRMFQDVPKADVIVTNPTHLSVALKYDAETMIAPEVIAKGADLIALKIREIAKEHDIPIVENVPLARGLYKTVEIGQGVPKTLYKAVAEVLAFVYKLKRRKKALKSEV
ncbi:MAG: flagellar biosynthesis protein FlhB [Halobacteriovoraceae bacterium]|nr:flagellar biosynthesis protein FlhB [Halobacteriovoraceae bacterium]